MTSNASDLNSVIIDGIRIGGTFLQSENHDLPSLLVMTFRTTHVDHGDTLVNVVVKGSLADSCHADLPDGHQARVIGRLSSFNGLLSVYAEHVSYSIIQEATDE